MWKSNFDKTNVGSPALFLLATETPVIPKDLCAFDPAPFSVIIGSGFPPAILAAAFFFFSIIPDDRFLNIFPIFTPIFLAKKFLIKLPNCLVLYLPDHAALVLVRQPQAHGDHEAQAQDDLHLISASQ